MKRIIILILFFMAFSLPASAQQPAEEFDFYAEEYALSGADELKDRLPEETRRFFDENGLDAKDYNWVNKLDTKSVFGHITEFVLSGAKEPISASFAVLAVILITAALSAMGEKKGVMTTAVSASTLSVAAVLLVPVYASISAAVEAMKGSATFMIGFVPIFAAVTAVSGGTVTSVSMSGLLLSAAETVTAVSAFVILPLMGGYLAMSISSSVSPLVEKSGIADGIKRIAFWVLSLITTVFIGVLGIQTAVNSAADGLSVKTAKFILGSSVPIAGTALSEAFSTVTASMSLLKSSVGIYAVAAIAVIFLPIILELALWRLSLLLTGSVAQLFSQAKISSVLKAVDSMISLLIGVLLLTAAMFIISLAVVISAGKA